MYTGVRFQKQPGRNDKCDQYKQNQQENETKEKEKTVIHSDQIQRKFYVVQHKKFHCSIDVVNTYCG